MNRFATWAAVGVTAVSATATVLTGSPTASATASSAVVTNVRTAAAFDYAAGQQAENITINPDRSLTVSMLGSPAGQPPELLRVSPSGKQTVLVRGILGDTFAGNTRRADGTVYYNLDSADAARAGIWALSPNGSTRRVASVPANTFLNGLAIDPSGRTLYAADTLGSTVWSASASGGTARRWLVNSYLAPSLPAPNNYGANGLRFHDGAVWVSDTNQGLLMRIPVSASGAPGALRVVADGLAGIDDFNFLSPGSDVVFAALNGPDEVAVVYPNGASRIVLTAENGLDSPTATAVTGDEIYITDGGVAAPYTPKLQVGRVNFGALATSSGKR